MHGKLPHEPAGVNLLQRPSAAAPGRNQDVAISPARRMGRTGPHRCRTGPQRVQSFTDDRRAHARCRIATFRCRSTLAHGPPVLEVSLTLTITSAGEDTGMTAHRRRELAEPTHV